ncbi:sugar phosphate isomerase/epimerase family protein [Granulicella sibirica]|uniref:Sugar phosphate isomerase n=1 Tax=Granulicella sibirica TaxID=2479048 RepID=A0A4Q0T4L4_9BACT|nr:sugar phosphate isomerase/epimerase [Granulicella sibirica]RXH58603.1 Sugar phosphate isomerase [Granulicella sibirica]
MISRRSFLGRASAAAACTALAGRASLAYATPLGLPLGIQLYSVREQLAKDYDATLIEVGKAGFKEVEAAGFYKKSAAEVKQSLKNAKLHCVSSHHPFGDLRTKFDEILAFNKELGVQYMICSSPGFKTPAPAGGSDRGRKMSIDDWRWISDQFNQMGEKTAAQGIHFGYHNHIHEFGPVDGTIPYMELLRLTDPAKVTLELDCGWATVAGMKPIDLMREHPNRFSMLHVKDFKDNGTFGPDAKEPVVTELGMGSIDYKPIFAEAKKTQKIKHMFVEQEAFDMPWQQSLKTDADYLTNLKA